MLKTDLKKILGRELKMLQSELKIILESTGLPVVYGSWKKAPRLPYIVFIQSRSTNVCADNKVYFKIKNFDIELYSESKDLESEKKLEDALDENDIYYESSGDIEIKEKFVEVIYSIEV